MKKLVMIALMLSVAACSTDSTENTSAPVAQVKESPFNPDPNPEDYRLAGEPSFIRDEKALSAPAPVTARWLPGDPEPIWVNADDIQDENFKRPLPIKLIMTKFAPLTIQKKLNMGKSQNANSNPVVTGDDRGKTIYEVFSKLLDPSRITFDGKPYSDAVADTIYREAFVIFYNGRPATTYYYYTGNISVPQSWAEDNVTGDNPITDDEVRIEVVSINFQN